MRYGKREGMIVQPEHHGGFSSDGEQTAVTSWWQHGLAMTVSGYENGAKIGLATTYLRLLLVSSGVGWEITAASQLYFSWYGLGVLARSLDQSELAMHEKKMSWWVCSLEWMAVMLSLSLGLPVIGSPWGQLHDDSLQWYNSLDVSSKHSNDHDATHLWCYQEASSGLQMMICKLRVIGRIKGWKRRREKDGGGLNTYWNHATKRAYLSSTKNSSCITLPNHIRPTEGYANLFPDRGFSRPSSLDSLCRRPKSEEIRLSELHQYTDTSFPSDSISSPVPPHVLYWKRGVYTLYWPSLSKYRVLMSLPVGRQRV